MSRLMVGRYFEGEGKIFPARNVEAYKSSFVSECLSVVKFHALAVFFFTGEISFWYPVIGVWLCPVARIDVLKRKNLFLLPGIDS